MQTCLPETHPARPVEREGRDGQPAPPSRSHAARSGNVAAEGLGSALWEQHGQGIMSPPLHASLFPSSQTI